MAPPPAPPPPLDAAMISKLIREELDRNNKTVEFIQGQIEKDRTFYKYLYSFAAGVIAILAGLAVVVSYTSIGQMRADMKASVDAELERDKAEIAALRAQAQTTVSTELQNVHAEVQKRVDTEFKSENINTTIRDVAKRMTERELQGIIRSEVAAQVAKAIEQEKPTIQKAVENETKRAVHELEPTIKGIVTKEIQTQVQQSVAPIREQMIGYGEMIRVGNLCTLARNGDRRAFDQLDMLANASALPDVKKVAQATELAIMREKNFIQRSPLHMPGTPVELKRIMTTGSNTTTRLAAIDSYPMSDASIVPTLVQIINNDDDIDVIVTAFNSLDLRTGQRFRFPNYEGLNDWWNKNKDRYVNK